MKVNIKIRLVDKDDEPFMGIGLVWLLTRIGRFHSISRAAKDMGMSYVKAHSILKRLERGLGHPVLVRRRGGACQGGAELTPFAEEFLTKFARHNDRINLYARKEFAGFLKSLRKPH